MKKAYLLFMRFIEIFENVVCSVGLVFTTLLVFVQVLNRYWLHFEIMWIGDFALYCFTFTMLMSIAFTTRVEGHTRVDVFLETFFADKGSSSKRDTYIIILDFISLGILCAFLPVVLKFTLRAIKYPEYGTLVRWFNTCWLVESMFVMHVLSIYHTIHNIAVKIIQLQRLGNVSLSQIETNLSGAPKTKLDTATTTQGGE